VLEASDDTAFDCGAVTTARGWPDESFPANAVVSERKRVDEAATFLGFDD